MAAPYSALLVGIPRPARAKPRVLRPVEGGDSAKRARRSGAPSSWTGIRRSPATS